MTKDQLIQALEPFTGEIQLVIHDAQKGQTFEIDHAHYGLVSDGTGVLVLVRGAQKMWPALRQNGPAHSEGEKHE